MNFKDRLIQRWNSKIDKTGYGFAIKDDFSQQTIKKNITRDLRAWLKIASDVDLIEVSQTQDTKDYTITFTDGKGNQCTLWLDDNKLSSISAY